MNHSDPLPEFLRPLERNSGSFPREALEEAIARRDESIPHLLRALEARAASAAPIDPGSDYWLDICALFLLAQFREPRAFEPMLRLARHPVAEPLLDDLLTENFHAMLAATCGRERIHMVEALVEDETVNKWVRSAAVEALGTMMFIEPALRERVSLYFGELMARKLARTPHIVWDAVISVCASFRMSEHLPAIRAAYQEGLVDPIFDTLDHIEEAIVAPIDNPAELCRYILIEDAVAELEEWATFESDPEPWNDSPFASEEIPGFFDDEPAEPRERRVKTGRNEPCPCGSQKKYKKCCGSAAPAPIYES